MLKKVTNEFIEEVDVIKKELFGLAFKNYEAFADMSCEEFMAIQKLDKLLESSMNIMRAQAEMLDDMNRKLDKLVSKKD